MTNDQFDKLYKHMTERFDLLHEEVGEVKQEVQGIYSHLDDIRGLFDTDELEPRCASVQLNRHEKAITEHDKKLTALLRRRVA